MDNKTIMEKQVQKNMEHHFKKGFKIFFAVLFGIAVAFLLGYLVMRLWNWLIPDLFGLPLVGYWQAVGLLLLAKLFFGMGSAPGKSARSKTPRRIKRCSSLRRDFSEWEHYEDFWNEEGEKAYRAYVDRRQNDPEAP